MACDCGYMVDETATGRMKMLVIKANLNHTAYISSVLGAFYLGSNVYQNGPGGSGFNIGAFL